MYIIIYIYKSQSGNLCYGLASKRLNRFRSFFFCLGRNCQEKVLTDEKFEKVIGLEKYDEVTFISESEEALSQRIVFQQVRNARRTTSAGPSTNPASRRMSRISRRAQAMEFAAFHYDSEMDYSEHGLIGGMTVRCLHCAAAKFPGEKAGVCCANGKVKLPAFESPPNPLHSLIFGTSPTSKHFLSNNQEYNTSFQITSFGATKVIRDSFMPTFKIQGQIYHRTDSLLPFPDTEPQFLQIYFVGNRNDELNRRCAIASSARRHIILDLQIFFHQHNGLVQLFKTALDLMPSDNHRIVIRADKTPFGEYARRFNAPTIDEVAIVIVGEQFLSRDIVLHRRNEQLQRVSELHQSYDALQYPLLHWKGDDGYHFNIPMIDPRTGRDIPGKTVSAMNYYSYRFMVHPQEDNFILRFGKLFNQYAVDMYTKIESERLDYLRFNQAQLRSEEYIHLQDAIMNNGDVNNNGRLKILPATYIGSPRHMHQYTQDVMSYVRKYGRPDLFITFTCNPQFEEIESADGFDYQIASIWRGALLDVLDRMAKERAAACTYIDMADKKNVNFGKIRIELKIGTHLRYIITIEMSKVPIDPTVAKNLIRGQRLQNRYLSSNTPNINILESVFRFALSFSV
ncbi:hypothetical protein AGLY_014178 [Aphis glycines]|uniref:Helitron helicase-like domain-containing protein n=1 Tax=Aphis glycines TaxID=307491 RepID=A0A6G0T4B4_APHGL|nr:hypothetical protein AGLY_014178 [Aphis glycines]